MLLPKSAGDHACGPPSGINRPESYPRTGSKKAHQQRAVRHSSTHVLRADRHPDLGTRLSSHSAALPAQASPGTEAPDRCPAGNGGMTNYRQPSQGSPSHRIFGTFRRWPLVPSAELHRLHSALTQCVEFVGFDTAHELLSLSRMNFSSGPRSGIRSPADFPERPEKRRMD
jgi:hypothetical protein